MLELKLAKLGPIPFNHGTLLPLLKDYRRPNDKIAEWIKAGVLISLRRGLYVVGDAWRQGELCLPLISNHLYGPSCVSLEYALAWHGLIPERVAEITAVTPKRTRTIQTPLARFSYRTLAQRLYSIGIGLEAFSDGYFLLAGPEKALCDKLVLTRHLQAATPQAMQRFLEKDLRIDMDGLMSFDLRVVGSYVQAGIKVRQFAALMKLLTKMRR